MTQDAKTHSIIVKVSYIEKNKIHGAAQAQGRTVSGYLRHCAIKTMEMDGYNMEAIQTDTEKYKYIEPKKRIKGRETREEFCARTGVKMEDFGTK